MPDTIFTKIINREIPADIEYENEHILAFRDISPQAPIHIIIIPKKAIRTINDVGEEDALLLGEMILAAKTIAHEKGIADSGYRVVINCNADGGQSVYHLHLHLLAGRKMTWPPG